jgi:hypothetical protein
MTNAEFDKKSFALKLRLMGLGLFKGMLSEDVAVHVKVREEAIAKINELLQDLGEDE